MTRTKLTLSIAAMFLLSVRVHAQEPSGHSGVRARESRFQLVEAEIEMKMHELGLRTAKRAVEEAMVESEKIKLRVEAAQEQGGSRELRHAKLELKQAGIRVEMQRVESEMARLKLELARARLEHIRAALTVKPGKPTRVQLEYVDDLDVVVIRGAKRHVERIAALIRGAKKEKKERE